MEATEPLSLRVVIGWVKRCFSAAWISGWWVGTASLPWFGLAVGSQKRLEGKISVEVMQTLTCQRLQIHFTHFLVAVLISQRLFSEL